MSLFFIYNDMNYHHEISMSINGDISKKMNLEFPFDKIWAWKNYEFQFIMRTITYHWTLESYIISLKISLFIYVINIIVVSQDFCKHNIITHQIGNDPKAWQYTVGKLGEI